MDNLVEFRRDDEPTQALVLRTLQTDEGAVRIAQRPDDGYINLTQLCKAAGKEYSNWRQTDRAQEYINELSSVLGIPWTGLIIIKQGGTPYEQGTWGHPRIALRVAQWCSAKFEVQVDGWLHEGLTNLSAKPVSGMDLIRQQIETLAEMFSELESVQARQELIEANQTVTDAKVGNVEKRLNRLEQETAPPGYMTALGYCRMEGIHPPKAPQALGTRASQICKQRKIERFAVPDVRFGTVYAYPLEILKEAAADIGLDHYRSDR